jgi:DNA-binding FadR family transcriptional regulator
VRRIQSSYHQVADQLRSLITTGDLGVGERLPSEAEMAPLFGVSRSTIREALRILVTDGLLVTRRGVQGGTFVAELDPGRVEAVLNDAFHILAVTDRVSASDFLDAWRAIEVPAAGLAARRRGGDALGRLAAATEPVGPDQPRPKRLRHSQDFHFALLNASGNLLLEAMGRPVSAVAQARFSQTAPTDEFWTANTDEHRRIYEAIAAGDAKRAEQEAAHHIEALREYYARSGVSAVQAGAPTRRNTTRRRSKSSPIVPAGGSPRT